MGSYYDRIKEAHSIGEIEMIVEEAANDDSISNEEYCNVYSFAVSSVME